MEYVKSIQAKTRATATPTSDQPVLSTEDENFLTRITAPDSRPAPLIDHGGDAQVALMRGAQNIPLPPETADEFGREEGGVGAAPDGRRPRPTWSWLRRDSRHRRAAGASLHALAQHLRDAEPGPSDGLPADDAESRREEREMTEILDQLHLAAVDNRVFSISADTQRLLRQFTQVLHDLVNGVPTAYRDLESLLVNGDRQLQKTYGALPPFLQKLIERLPDTITKSFAPAVMAAAAERSTAAGAHVAQAGHAAGPARNGLQTPSLADLVAKPSAVAGMLRSIITFLRARFPAFMGMNVLWSLALFVLLFVFWYCHKRGREVRLSKEHDQAAATARPPDMAAATPSAPVSTPGERPSADPRVTPRESSELGPTPTTRP